MFSIIYLLESCLLIANALGILSERFLGKCNFYLKKTDGMETPFQQEQGSFSAKNQVAFILYFFRVYGKCKLYFFISGFLVMGNAAFITYEILLG